MQQDSRRIIFALPFFVLLAACQPSPPAANALIYDAPVSLTIKTDTLLPGTSIAYGGKTATGAGKVLIAGLEAPKQVGDSVDWQGSPVPDVTVKLATRVATFDDKSIVLIGTAHVEVANISVKPGGTPGTALMEFTTAPTPLTLKKNEFVPGSNLAYAGAAPEGAQFLGIEGYPYRKTGDSLQYVGRISSKVFLRLEMRVVRFTDADVVLLQTANIRIES
jgi:hypothetical protein